MSQNKNNCLKCGQEIDPQSDQTHKCEEDKKDLESDLSLLSNLVSLKTGICLCFDQGPIKGTGAEFL